MTSGPSCQALEARRAQHGSFEVVCQAIAASSNRSLGRGATCDCAGRWVRVGLGEGAILAGGRPRRTITCDSTNTTYGASLIRGRQPCAPYVGGVQCHTPVGMTAAAAGLARQVHQVDAPVSCACVLGWCAILRPGD